MTEKSQKTLLQTTADKLKAHIATMLSAGIVLLAGLLWHWVGSEKTSNELIDRLTPKTTVALLILLFVLAVYGMTKSFFLHLKVRKMKNEKPAIERL